MSAGPMLFTRYQADDGKIFPVRINEETSSAVLAGQTNTPPEGQPGSGLPSARVGAGRRSFGVNCRGVRVVFDETIPDNYKEGVPIFIPVLRKAVYDAIPSRNGSGTYLGNSVRIVGKVPEKIN